MFRILAIAATFLGLTAAAQADVWRFVDAKGNVQYSDKWVPGSVLVKTEHVSGGPSFDGSTSTGDQQKLAASDASIASQQQAAAAQQQVRTDVQKQKDEDCKKYSAEYQKAIESRRLYKEKDGQRIYASDTEADAYRLELFNRRQQACGK
jgi:hypothetical protein